MKKTISIFTLLCFILTGLGIPPVYSQPANSFALPAPGVMVHLSPPENPAILKGIKVHTDNPFRFDFILDKGDEKIGQEDLKQESEKLIKYFLASLTIPEKDLWVNLSPYEKDRIVPESFGVTEMGRDLLAQDYMLKQITASLIYPEDEVGKKFWKRIYEEAAKKYNTTNIPVNTFNKVWIVPEKAVVYENLPAGRQVPKAGTAYVVESKLKVMLEEDYLSLEKHATGTDSNSAVRPILGQELVSVPNHVKASQGTKGTTNEVNQIGSQIIREIVIPELTKEINEGKNFSQLRQVYNSLILATWYKKKIKDSILSKVYSDKSKTKGINIEDPQEKEKIYQQYLQAFKKGVYNYIKEESDPITQQPTPRKYFSGGFNMAMVTPITTADAAMLPRQLKNAAVVTANLQTQDPAQSGDNAARTASDSAMIGSDKFLEFVYHENFIEQMGQFLGIKTHMTQPESDGAYLYWGEPIAVVRKSFGGPVQLINEEHPKERIFIEFIFDHETEEDEENDKNGRVDHIYFLKDKFDIKEELKDKMIPAVVKVIDLLEKKFKNKLGWKIEIDDQDENIKLLIVEPQEGVKLSSQTSVAEYISQQIEESRARVLRYELLPDEKRMVIATVLASENRWDYAGEVLVSTNEQGPIALELTQEIIKKYLKIFYSPDVKAQFREVFPGLEISQATNLHSHFRYKLRDFMWQYLEVNKKLTHREAAHFIYERYQTDLRGVIAFGWITPIGVGKLKKMADPAQLALAPADAAMGTQDDQTGPTYDFTGPVRQMNQAKIKDGKKHWGFNIRKSKEYILEGMRQIPEARRHRVSVLGAGSAAEIPLEELARNFDEVELIDIDQEALNKAVAQLPGDLQSKIQIKVQDITSGAVAGFLGRAKRIIENNVSAQESARLIIEEMASTSFDSIDPTLIKNKSDYVISSLVADQIFMMMHEFMNQEFKKKYRREFSDVIIEAKLVDLFNQISLPALDRSIENHARLLQSISNPEAIIYWSSTYKETARRDEFNREQKIEFRKEQFLLLKQYDWKKILTPEIRTTLLQSYPLEGFDFDKELSKFSSFNKYFEHLNRMIDLLLHSVVEGVLPENISEDILNKTVLIVEKINKRLSQKTSIGKSVFTEYFPPYLQPMDQGKEWLWTPSAYAIIRGIGYAYYVHAHLLKPAPADGEMDEAMVNANKEIYAGKPFITGTGADKSRWIHEWIPEYNSSYRRSKKMSGSYRIYLNPLPEDFVLAVEMIRDALRKASAPLASFKFLVYQEPARKLAEAEQLRSTPQETKMVIYLDSPDDLITYIKLLKEDSRYPKIRSAGKLNNTFPIDGVLHISGGMRETFRFVSPLSNDMLNGIQSAGASKSYEGTPAWEATWQYERNRALIRALVAKAIIPIPGISDEGREIEHQLFLRPDQDDAMSTEKQEDSTQSAPAPADGAMKAESDSSSAWLRVGGKIYREARFIKSLRSLLKRIVEGTSIEELTAGNFSGFGFQEDEIKSILKEFGTVQKIKEKAQQGIYRIDDYFDRNGKSLIKTAEQLGNNRIVVANFPQNQIITMALTLDGQAIRVKPIGCEKSFTFNHIRLIHRPREGDQFQIFTKEGYEFILTEELFKEFLREQKYNLKTLTNRHIFHDESGRAVLNIDFSNDKSSRLLDAKTLQLDLYPNVKLNIDMQALDDFVMRKYREQGNKTGATKGRNRGIKFDEWDAAMKTEMVYVSWGHFRGKIKEPYLRENFWPTNTKDWTYHWELGRRDDQSIVLRLSKSNYFNEHVKKLREKGVSTVQKETLLELLLFDNQPLAERIFDEFNTVEIRLLITGSLDLSGGAPYLDQLPKLVDALKVKAKTIVKKLREDNSEDKTPEQRLTELIGDERDREEVVEALGRYKEYLLKTKEPADHMASGFLHTDLQRILFDIQERLEGVDVRVARSILTDFIDQMDISDQEKERQVEDLYSVVFSDHAMNSKAANPAQLAQPADGVMTTFKGTDGQSRKLTFIKDLSSSDDFFNPRALYQDQDGKEYLVKSLGTSVQAVGEYIGYRFFKLLDLPVPDSYDIVQDPSGNFALVRPYVDNFKTLRADQVKDLTPENEKILRLASYADAFLLNHYRRYKDIQIDGQKISFFDWEFTLGTGVYNDLMTSGMLGTRAQIVKERCRLNQTLRLSRIEIFNLEQQERKYREVFIELLRRNRDAIERLFTEVEQVSVFASAFQPQPLQRDFKPYELADAVEMALENFLGPNPSRANDFADNSLLQSIQAQRYSTRLDLDALPVIPGREEPYIKVHQTAIPGVIVKVSNLSPSIYLPPLKPLRSDSSNSSKGSVPIARMGDYVTFFKEDAAMSAREGSITPVFATADVLTFGIAGTEAAPKKPMALQITPSGLYVPVFKPNGDPWNIDFEGIHQDFTRNMVGTATQHLAQNQMTGSRFGPYVTIHKEYAYWMIASMPIPKDKKEVTLVDLGSGEGIFLLRAALTLGRLYPDKKFRLYGLEADQNLFNASYVFSETAKHEQVFPGNVEIEVIKGDYRQTGREILKKADIVSYFDPGWIEENDVLVASSPIAAQFLEENIAPGAAIIEYGSRNLAKSLGKVKSGGFAEKQFLHPSGKRSEFQIYHLDPAQLARITKREDLIADANTPWDQVFNEPGKPLYVEIGPGRGNQLIQLAQRHPQANFLVIEPTFSGQLLSLLWSEGIQNVRVIESMDHFAFEKANPQGIVDAIYSIHPHPKASSPYLFKYHKGAEKIMQALKPGGAFIITPYEPWHQAFPKVETWQERIEGSFQAYPRVKKGSLQTSSAEFVGALQDTEDRGGTGQYYIFLRSEPNAAQSAQPADGAMKVTAERATEYSNALSELYSIIDEKSSDVVIQVLRAISNPLANLNDDKVIEQIYFQYHPNLKSWIEKMRSSFPDIKDYTYLITTSMFTPTDLLFTPEGDAVVIQGTPRSGKSSLAVSLSQAGLNSGGEDIIILFQAGGFLFAATQDLHKQEGGQVVSRARAFEGKAMVKKVSRGGVVKSIISMKREPGASNSFLISERLQEGRTDLLITHNLVEDTPRPGSVEEFQKMARSVLDALKMDDSTQTAQEAPADEAMSSGVDRAGFPKEARVLIEKGETIVSADDGTKFIFKLTMRPTVGRNSFTITVQREGGKATDGYIDVTQGNEIGASFERHKDRWYAIQVKQNQGYEGIGRTLMALAMWISKNFRKNKFFVRKSTDTGFYKKLGFDEINTSDLSFDLTAKPLPAIKINVKTNEVVTKKKKKDRAMSSSSQGEEEQEIVDGAMLAKSKEMISIPDLERLKEQGYLERQLNGQMLLFTLTRAKIKGSLREYVWVNTYDSDRRKVGYIKFILDEAAGTSYSYIDNKPYTILDERKIQEVEGKFALRSNDINFYVERQGLWVNEPLRGKGLGPLLTHIALKFNQQLKVREMFFFSKANLFRSFYQHYFGAVQDSFGTRGDSDSNFNTKCVINTALKVYEKRDASPAQMADDKTGGIDLTPAQMNLETQNSGDEIKFKLNPAMLKQLQNAPGFYPVIINIQPLTDLRGFLGIAEIAPVVQSG